MRALTFILLFLISIPAQADWQAFDYDFHSSATANDVGNSQWLVIGYPYDNCNAPILRIVDTLTNPNQITTGTLVPLQLRVDDGKKWHWSATLEKTLLDDRIYVSVNTPAHIDFVGELITGNRLEITTGKTTSIVWLLDGAANALSVAFQFCIQGADEAEKQLIPEESLKRDNKKYF